MKVGASLQEDGATFQKVGSRIEEDGASFQKVGSRIEEVGATFQKVGASLFALVRWNQKKSREDFPPPDFIKLFLKKLL